MNRMLICGAMLALLAMWGGGALGAECPDPPSAEGLRAICGIAAPEDVVVFEDRFVIVSSMAPATRLFFVDARDDSSGALATSLSAPGDGRRWGDDSCPPPAALVSHGIDLSRDADGRWRLLVVSHGERESIEFFEVLPDDDAPPRLQWRGCVLTPGESVFNDVAALPDGGYLATDPSGANWPRTRALLALLGFDVGRVYRWRPGSGHEAVPNSGAPYPNGIVLDPEGDAFYVNAYFADEVRKHDLASGELLARVAVEQPDNSNWSPDGRLWVASHRGSIMDVVEAVEASPATRNTIPFAIVEVDPADMSAADVVVNDGSDLGGGTAAAQAGGAMYIGAFRGDRLLRVALPRPPR